MRKWILGVSLLAGLLSGLCAAQSPLDQIRQRVNAARSANRNRRLSNDKIVARKSKSSRIVRIGVVNPSVPVNGDPSVHEAVSVATRAPTDDVAEIVGLAGETDNCSAGPLGVKFTSTQ